MKLRQEIFEGLDQKNYRKPFGGSELKHNARESRPLSFKQSMHLVLRSTQAKGELSFLNPKRAEKIRALVYSHGKRTGVKVYRYANSGNHLHLIIAPHNRVGYTRFIRTITGLIARLTLGAERGKAVAKKFWDARPFTRIISWGKEFKTVSNYLYQNILEAIGFLPYTARSRPKTRMREAIFKRKKI